MTTAVEGDWKGFSFKFVTPADHQPILDFLRKYWYHDEILSKYAGVDEVSISEFEGYCKVIFSKEPNLSFIAWSKEFDEIASIRLSSVKRSSDKFPLDIQSNGGKKIMKLFAKLDSEAKIFERFGVDCLVNLSAACTATKYRGQGLVTEMYRRSIALFKEKGFVMCNSMFTSPYTRKSATNLGFTEISRVYLKDFCDENGDMDFKGAGEDDFILFYFMSKIVTFPIYLHNYT